MKKFRFAQNHADIVITGSQATKTDIVTYLNIEPDRIEVVPYGVSPAFHPVTDRQRLIDALEPLGLEPDAYILHVGTLEPRKNLVRLLKAYHKVRQSDGDAVPKLALVGPIGWGIKEIVAVIDTLGLEDAVVITGAVNSELVPILYSGALFFVYPSLYEGFGLPPLESMACGTPVITSNVSSIPEVVGDAAVMIAPENISDLADAMQLLMSDDDQRIALRYAGNQRASLFSWRRTAAQTLRIYNKHLTI
jgi:glycosyltransferase involved in cell wall biosynthesis